jgi:hypothetical protein
MDETRHDMILPQVTKPPADVGSFIGARREMRVERLADGSNRLRTA